MFRSQNRTWFNKLYIDPQNNSSLIKITIKKNITVFTTIFEKFTYLSPYYYVYVAILKYKLI